jgi:hypothetical protein
MGPEAIMAETRGKLSDVEYARWQKTYEGKIERLLEGLMQECGYAEETEETFRNGLLKQLADTLDDGIEEGNIISDLATRLAIHTMVCRYDLPED